MNFFSKESITENTKISTVVTNEVIENGNTVTYSSNFSFDYEAFSSI